MWERVVMIVLMVGMVAGSIMSRENDRRRPLAANIGQKPNPEQLAFFSHTVCVQKCMLNCQPIMAENQNTFYLCPKIKPPEVSLSERFMAKASWPWMLFLGLIGMMILLCVLCSCWSCCCKGKHRSEHSSRDPLAENRTHLRDEIVAENCVQGYPYISRGQRISGSKYVVDV
ncbi:unnamed protein product [Bursaphelenchus xylophilus]|uniref:(pine wood nematode) hypothetical protein n=1 Tax=Bursaphelenchus xylophilus TaxID=6326 RepID=A0A1I7RQV6_BURXY|nr:unnamed protein product [Bursaphelenchus xylophilus]CAG9130697.1 unnamed protein product [Bursaphelenchus xylophilus]